LRCTTPTRSACGVHHAPHGMMLGAGRCEHRQNCTGMSIHARSDDELSRPQDRSRPPPSHKIGHSPVTSHPQGPHWPLLGAWVCQNTARVPPAVTCLVTAAAWTLLQKVATASPHVLDTAFCTTVSLNLISPWQSIAEIQPSHLPHLPIPTP
jgi:hypothetical protein